MKYIPAKRDVSEFHCPRCHVFAAQGFTTIGFIDDRIMIEGVSAHKFVVSKCHYCKKWCIWEGDRLISPTTSIAPMPAEDTPEDVKADFEEARNVFGVSPRSSAALLRLALQKLCKKLGEPGENINKDIGSLVKKGLPSGVKDALDVVRVVGNNAVHPGEIEVHNEPETVLTLFDLTEPPTAWKAVGSTVG
jgi:Domain of unknown function (DUF4145)